MAKVLVIGAGHNGLLAAFYLLKAGHEVTVLERAGFTGGACAGFQRPCGCIFHPGASHFGMLNDRIFRDLKSAGASLHCVAASAQTIIPFPNCRPVVLYDDVEETAQSIAYHNVKDGRRFLEFARDLSVAVDCYAPLRTCPEATREQFIAALESHDLAFPRLFATGSVAETLQYYFEDDGVRGALASSMLLYNASTSEPGSAFAFPFYGQMMVEGAPGWRMLAGGMSVLTDAIAELVKSIGGKIELDTEVRRLEVDSGRIRSAVDVHGRSHSADLFLAACDPLRAGQLLLNGGYSSPNWDELRRLWLRPAFQGMCGKANFLLRRRPTFRHVPAELQIIASRTLTTNLTSLRAMDEAFATAMARGVSDIPYVEILLPSEIDPTQGCGHHCVMSVYFMYSLSEYCVDAGVVRSRLMAALNEVLDDDFHDCVVDEEILSSRDLSALFGLSRGNVDHGSLTPEYSFNRRGLPGRAPPSTDLDNLFLASAGAAPGGLVSGIPGMTAALAASGSL